MKITDKRRDPVAFKKLSTGEVFKAINPHNFYLRTSDVTDFEGNVMSNAVNLSNGLVHYFDGDIAVMVVEAELIVT